MLNHVSVGSNDLGRARAFYDPVMSLLGMRLILSDERSLNYGTGDLFFSIETPVDGRSASPGNGVHVAFSARNRGMVCEFHQTALAHGGTDDGAPGLRPEYDAHYFGAFVRDPDGNKLEAVSFSAE